ncbi:OsmC family protein [Reichenbachiella sp. MALMAid0571]|uniref:OsmC family protein n=1 Tax=Reichenbachiella sp. MALMAid0571 TaxID=3143939 RepID=UPI0032DF3434
MSTPKQVHVKVGHNGYTTEITAGNHSLLADEPKEVGGNDLGPNPYALLLSSLGACTAITIKMYANRKEWKLDEVLVGLSHSKEYTKDCDDCEQSNAKIDFIEREIELIGDLDDTQKARLMDIANKCPVHKTLHSKIEVETTLVST